MNGKKVIAMTMTLEEFLEKVEEGEGLCLNCYKFTKGKGDWVEPDAEHYTCTECEEDFVIGLESALTDGNIVIK